MIIVNIAGGLGNQMFQYALGKAVSMEKNTELLLYIKDTHNNQHNDFELNRAFGIQAKLAKWSDIKEALGFRTNPWIMRRMRSRNWLRGNRYFLEPHFHYTNAVFNVHHHAFIKGYWQSENYFSKYRDEILRDFSFNKKVSQENEKIIENIKSHVSVSIHVRRGDYLSPNTREVHGIMDVDYYRKAISLIDTQSSDSLYVLFSDDIGWVKNNLLNLLKDKNYLIVTGNAGSQSYNDMALMSLCNHNIIANSSFSWWGAWLNANSNKKIIAPKKWFAGNNMDTKDLCPASWVKI